MLFLLSEWFNKPTVFNQKTLYDAIENCNGQGLITVSNHNCCIDDPIIWGKNLAMNMAYK